MKRVCVRKQLFDANKTKPSTAAGGMSGPGERERDSISEGNLHSADTDCDLNSLHRRSHCCHCEHCTFMNRQGTLTDRQTDRQPVPYGDTTLQ